MLSFSILDPQQPFVFKNFQSIKKVLNSKYTKNVELPWSYSNVLQHLRRYGRGISILKGNLDELSGPQGRYYLNTFQNSRTCPNVIELRILNEKLEYIPKFLKSCREDIKFKFHIITNNLTPIILRDIVDTRQDGIYLSFENSIYSEWYLKLYE